MTSVTLFPQSLSVSCCIQSKLYFLQIHHRLSNMLLKVDQTALVISLQETYSFTTEICSF